MEKDCTSEGQGVLSSDDTPARREFLVRLGRFALYTSPIFMELSLPSAHAFGSDAPIETQTAAEEQV